MILRGNMKIHIIITCLLVLLFGIPAISQIEFPVPDNIDTYMYIDDFTPNINPGTKSFAIRWYELPQLEKIDFSKFSKLKTIILKFGIAPDRSDIDKQKLISSVESNFKYLSVLRKCKTFENLVLKIGVFIFISSEEKLSNHAVRKMEDEDKCGNCRKEADSLNLKRANERFGSKLKQHLPGVKLYSECWAW